MLDQMPSCILQLAIKLGLNQSPLPVNNSPSSSHLGVASCVISSSSAWTLVLKLDLSAFLDLDQGPSKHGILHEVCYYDHLKSAFRSVALLAVGSPQGKALHIPTDTSEPGKPTTSLLTGFDTSGLSSIL